MNINLPCDLTDEVTRLSLLDNVINLSREIESIRERERFEHDLPAHKLADLVEAKKCRKAARRMLRYYSTAAQWASYNID